MHRTMNGDQPPRMRGGVKQRRGFGILVSTVLTLVVIPVLYYALYRKRHEGLPPAAPASVSVSVSTTPV